MAGGEDSNLEGWRRSVMGKPSATIFIPPGPPLTDEAGPCLTYVFTQQILIKHAFSENSARLWGMEKSEVLLGLPLLTEPSSYFAFSLHPSPSLHSPGANHAHLQLSLQHAKFRSISGLLCVLCCLPRTLQDGFLLFILL